MVPLETIVVAMQKPALVDAVPKSDVGSGSGEEGPLAVTGPAGPVFEMTTIPRCPSGTRVDEDAGEYRTQRGSPKGASR